MNVKESTISRRIRELEMAVGLAIFIRLQTGVSVTPAGAQFIHQAREALQAFDKALSRTSVQLATESAVAATIILEGRWIATQLTTETYGGGKVCSTDCA